MSHVPRTIVADPPWWPSLHKNTVGRSEGAYRAGPQRYYRLMEVADICAVQPKSAAKSHLWLWEQVLVCRKGGPAENAFGKTGGTAFQWPRGRHSEKPAAFFELVERVSPGPYLEMFARALRPGWSSWGDEVPALDRGLKNA